MCILSTGELPEASVSTYTTARGHGCAAGMGGHVSFQRSSLVYRRRKFLFTAGSWRYPNRSTRLWAGGDPTCTDFWTRRICPQTSRVCRAEGGSRIPTGVVSISERFVGLCGEIDRAGKIALRLLLLCPVEYVMHYAIYLWIIWCCFLFYVVYFMCICITYVKFNINFLHNAFYLFINFFENVSALTGGQLQGASKYFSMCSFCFNICCTWKICCSRSCPC